MSSCRLCVFGVLVVFASQLATASDYPWQTDEPQKTGWPISEQERAYVLRPEHDRRPGRESNRHLPALWPVVPSAGNWGGTSWLDTHAGLVEQVKQNAGPCDVLLVGDSITIQWGDLWKRHFPDHKAVNIGIGGDKTQNVLWRLDHGGVDGLQPRLIVLMIGNNNMFFTPETGIEAAARGIEMCVKNLREKFPQAAIIVAKILPAHAPGNRFHEDIRKTNSALDALKLQSDPRVFMLDMWHDFTDSSGMLRKELFTSDNIHLSPAGYAVYAARLQPMLAAFFSGKPIPAAAVMPVQPAVVTSPEKSMRTTTDTAPKAAAGIVLPSQPVLTYAYAAYNEGKSDPQIAGWPLSPAELAWVNKGEYTRKPGHEVQKHLPELWPVIPSAARWGDGEANPWLEHHAECIERVQAMKAGIDILLIGDSITQGWGGGWDGSPLNAAWQKHFGDRKTVNIGIGGDRTESVLWRLDHGAVHGVSPKTIVLMIGVNNANGVQFNGVPVSSAAEGIRLCVANLRQRCPQSQVVLVKILPAFDPATAVGAKVREINVAVDGLQLGSDPQVRVLDVWSDFTNADGSLKAELYSDQHLHLNAAGYEVLAAGIKRLIAAF